MWLRAAFDTLDRKRAHLRALFTTIADRHDLITTSIRRDPGAAGVAALLTSRGFTNIRVIPLLFGLMTLPLTERRR